MNDNELQIIIILSVVIANLTNTGQICQDLCLSYHYMNSDP